MSPIPPAGPDPPAPAPSAPGSAAAAADRPAIQRAAEHLAAGRPGEAADAFERLVAGAPTYAAAHVLHAVALEAAGRPDDALAAWHRAAFLVPGSPLVQRERQRLMAARPEAAPFQEPASVAAEPVAAEPVAAEPTPDDGLELAEGAVPAEPFAETGDVETAGLPTDDGPSDDAPEAWLADAEAEPDGADFPSLQTLPLDDLTLAPAGDEGDFDPDSFDFSAFDGGDEAPDWLADLEAAPAAEPHTLDLSEFAAEPAQSAWNDDAPASLADWADDRADETVRLMPPEGAPAAPSAPAEDEAGGWAVFEDEPAAAGVEAFDPPDEPFPAEPPLAATFYDEPPEPEPAPDELEAPPEETVPDEPPSVADELDSLIASLEHAPRIRPDPTFDGPAVQTTTAGMDEMVSETLAKIYAAQHQYVEAAIVYEKLAAREPDRAAAMLERAAEMRRRRA